MNPLTSPPFTERSRLYPRVYRGISGQRYREIHRTDSTVTLLSEYPVRGERTLTIPLTMLERFFEEHR